MPKENPCPLIGAFLYGETHEKVTISWYYHRAV